MMTVPFLKVLPLKELAFLTLYISSNFFSTSLNIHFQISHCPTQIKPLLYTFLVTYFSQTSLPLDSTLFSSTKSIAFSKFSNFSQVSSSAIYLFYLTKYFGFSLKYFLFNIFSTSYSFSLSISTEGDRIFLFFYLLLIYCYSTHINYQVNFH